MARAITFNAERVSYSENCYFIGEDVKDIWRSTLICPIKLNFLTYVSFSSHFAYNNINIVLWKSEYFLKYFKFYLEVFRYKV